LISIFLSILKTIANNKIKFDKFNKFLQRLFDGFDMPVIVRYDIQKEKKTLINTNSTAISVKHEVPTTMTA